MSTTSYDSIFSVGTSALIIPAGLTNAVLVNLNAVSGANANILKMVSGASLYLIGVGTGVTLTAAQLATTTAYVMDVGEKISFDGPTRFYLGSASSTCVVHQIYGLSQGF